MGKERREEHRYPAPATLHMGIMREIRASKQKIYILKSFYMNVNFGKFLYKHVQYLRSDLESDDDKDMNLGGKI